MNGSLLDKKTLAAVIAASPTLPGIREEAVQLLAVLKDNTSFDTYSSAIVQDLADVLTGKTGELVNPRSVGSLLRSMGLSGYRTREGYRYAWTKEQLDILDAALLNENPSAGTEGFSSSALANKSIVSEEVAQ